MARNRPHTPESIAYNTKWNNDNVEKRKTILLKNALKRYYNITLETFNKMFESQQGCCAICGTHQLELKRRLCVDHCHDTGKIRGLLCDACNKGIGHLNDDTVRLQKAIQYLKNDQDWSE